MRTDTSQVNERSAVARLSAVITWCAVPIIVFVLIWFPVVRHYYVRSVPITNDILEASRRLPPDSLLDELSRYRLLHRRWRGESQVVHAAEQLLHGNAEIPGYPSTKIGMPFEASDIDKGQPAWQLELASFVVPETFLGAYQVTHRDEFLLAARDVILGWEHYESSAWLPKGFLWNDHAIAARAPILAEFWRLYRNHPAYDAETGGAVIQMAARSGEMLAKPGHFTVATNHGVMQNLALWHLCLAFPGLPNREAYTQLAFDRLGDQMSFFVDSQGVILEHSAGYQASGIELLGLALRYLKLLEKDIPHDWRAKYDAAKQFYGQLKRPDSSLPVYGDTDAAPESPALLTTIVDDRGWVEPLSVNVSPAPSQPTIEFPVAGYSIWWDGLENWPQTQALSQTVAAWSFFPTRSHKHADEMSVLLWAGGQTWCTNVGYWPFGLAGRESATSWTGSNAPHLEGEPENSVRTTRLLSYGDSVSLRAIDLERDGPAGYVARRQLLHLKPDLWIVVDHTGGNETRQTTTTWTTASGVSLQDSNLPGSYVLTGENKSSTLALFIFGSPKISPQKYSGSLTPFAGWQVVNRVPKPAPALVIQQPAKDSWAVAIWSLNDVKGSHGPITSMPRMARWDGPQNWSLEIPLQRATLRLGRTEGEVNFQVGTEKDSKQVLRLTAASHEYPEATQIRSAYFAAAKKYHSYQPYMESRIKVTKFLFFVFLLQEVFFFVVRRVKRHYYVGLRLLNIAIWAGGCFWLLQIYWKW